MIQREQLETGVTAWMSWTHANHCWSKTTGTPFLDSDTPKSCISAAIPADKILLSSIASSPRTILHPSTVTESFFSAASLCETTALVICRFYAAHARTGTSKTLSVFCRDVLRHCRDQSLGYQVSRNDCLWPRPIPLLRALARAHRLFGNRSGIS